MPSFIPRSALDIEDRPRGEAKPKPPRGRPRQFDRDDLYRWLWKKSDANHRVVVNVHHLSAALNVVRKTLTNDFGVFCRQGKLSVVITHAPGIKTYQVADPETWNFDDPTTWAQKRRALKWG